MILKKLLFLFFVWLALRHPSPPAGVSQAFSDPRPLAPDSREYERRPFRPQPPRPTGRIVEAGNVGPGGLEVQCDLPPEMWRHNVESRGEGCCGFRSVDHAAHWQNVRQLWDFPEWLQAHGRPGGSYPEYMKEMIAAICLDRQAPAVEFLSYEGNDPHILDLALATGRMPAVTYDGKDGVHYDEPIAHVVNLVYLDEQWAAILDNNFPPTQLLWMSRQDFLARWSGWTVILLAPRPPAPPCN